MAYYLDENNNYTDGGVEVWGDIRNDNPDLGCIQYIDGTNNGTFITPGQGLGLEGAVDQDNSGPTGRQDCLKFVFDTEVNMVEVVLTNFTLNPGEEEAIWTAYEADGTTVAASGTFIATASGTHDDTTFSIDTGANTFAILQLSLEPKTNPDDYYVTSLKAWDSNEVTVELIPTDASGNEIPPATIEEEETAYYKAILVDADGNEIIGATGDVDVTFTDGTAVRTGTAALGTLDFQGNDQTVALNTVFSTDALDDYIAEGSETFDVQIEDGTYTNPDGYGNVLYDTTAVVTTIIDDNDPVYVQIVEDDSAIEGSDLTHKVKLVDGDGNPVIVELGETINVTVGYTGFGGNPATEGVDYVGTISVAIVGGTSETSFNNSTIDDLFNEGTEQYKATITNAAQVNDTYEDVQIDPAADSVLGDIVDDNDPVYVRLTGDHCVDEGYNARYKVTLKDAANQPVKTLTPLTVSLTYAYTTASDGDILKTLTTTIPAGSSSVDFQVGAWDDGIPEGIEHFTVALGSVVSGGTEFENLILKTTAVETAIHDADLGEEQVNTYFENNQYKPAVASLENGGFVVTWKSYGQDGDIGGIYAQRYDSNRVKVGDEVQVNTTWKDHQSEPAIAGMSNEGYVIIWTSYNQDGPGSGVYMQRYEADGSAVGGETRVNSETIDWQAEPAVVAVDGGYVVTWMSYGQDGSGRGIYMQRFDNAGAKQGIETLVNHETEGHQSKPTIAQTDSGYVIVWQSVGQESDGSTGIYAQRFDHTGNKLGAETLINSTMSGDQTEPTVTGLASGGYVVAWSSYGQDGSGEGVYMKQYAANGTLVVDEKQVNTTTAHDQSEPSVASLADGGYLITWNSYAQDGSMGGIFAQRYTANGTAVDGETQINTTTENHQSEPTVSGLEDGSYVVAWTSYGQDGSGDGIFIQQQTLGCDIEGQVAMDEVYTPDTGDTECPMPVENVVNGTNGNDNFLYGTVENDKISGLHGDDNIKGFAGNDCLYGGDGFDHLNGGAGDDFLVGGTGNDVLEGYEGDDTFVFNTGDGYDVIWSEGGDTGENTISFGAGIDKEDIAFFYDEDNGHVMIQYSDTDMIDLAGDGHPINFDGLDDSLLSATSNDLGISEIKLADGSILSGNAIEEMLVAINSYAGVDDVTAVRNNDEIMDDIVLVAWS